jgi:monovalent cation:H+ antiporter-2, CPA2 family
VVRLGLTGGAPVLVVEVDAGKVAQLKAENVDAIAGNAADPKIIRAAALERARCLIVAIPEAFEAGQIVEQARAASSNLLIIARAHSEQEIAYLRERGASLVVMGEYEIAKAMLVAVGPAGHARET